jgi:CRP-like cAMP-binding protein
LKTISLFAGELKLILLVVLSLGWLYAGLVYFTRLLSEVLLPSLPPILFADNRAEAVLVFFLTLMTLAVILGVLGLFCLTLIRVFRGDGGLTLANPREVDSDVGAVQSAINQNPLFEVLDDTTKAELAGVVTTLEFNPGENIVVQGHEAHQFFMLVQGSADVIQSADSGVETFLASLGPSDSFGEMALIDGGKRQASVRATTPTQVYALERGHFVDAISKSGASPDEVVGVLRSSSAIRKSEILGALAPASLRRLRELLVREQVPSNTVIIEEGAVGNQFYLIQAGNVSVEQKNASRPVAQLGPGDFFGEIALLSDIPRTASVRTTTDSILLSLNRENFRQVMAQDFKAGFALEIKGEERQGGRPS